MNTKLKDPDILYATVCKLLRSGANDNITVEMPLGKVYSGAETRILNLTGLDERASLHIFISTGSMWWYHKPGVVNIPLTDDQRENLQLLTEAYYLLYLKE